MKEPEGPIESPRFYIAVGIAALLFAILTHGG